MEPAISALLIVVKLGKLLLQVRYLRQIVVRDVRIVRMQLRIVLVITFRRIERLQRHNLGDDLMRKNFRLIQLRDVGLSYTLLCSALP